uniref:TGF-beta family profile domain-containing protein n=1 Tax=Strigamia maritima TaxID=126957 RepID=T1J1K9_STRMM
MIKCYLVFSLFLTCFITPPITTFEDSVVPIIENMAKFLFAKDFHIINNLVRHPNFRKPPEYIKSLFWMFDKAVSNEASNRNFTRVSIRNPDLKIRAIWPSKVFHSNSSITFMFSSLNIEKPTQAQLVTKRRKSSESANQKVFDVTESIVDWLERKKDVPQPLQLTVHTENPASTSYKGFLVLYYGIDHWQLLIASVGPVNRRRVSRQATSGDNKCQLRDWYVNFEHLGWNSWVMAPTGFHANLCSGECPSILMPEEYHASNHAMLRGLYRANQPEMEAQNVNPACCVPTSLRAISFIYVDEGGVTMRKLNNIIAEECGCQ